MAGFNAPLVPAKCWRPASVLSTTRSTTGQPVGCVSSSKGLGARVEIALDHHRQTAVQAQRIAHGQFVHVWAMAGIWLSWKAVALTGEPRDRADACAEKFACATCPRLRTTKQAGEQRGGSRWRRCWGLERGCVHGTRCMSLTSNLTLRNEYDDDESMVGCTGKVLVPTYSSHSTTVPWI